MFPVRYELIFYIGLLFRRNTVFEVLKTEYFLTNCATISLLRKRELIEV
jgi:hypothetical protein